MIVYILVKRFEYDEERLELLGVFKHMGAAQKAQRALETADRALDRSDNMYTILPWTVNEASPLPEENIKEEDK